MATIAELLFERGRREGENRRQAGAATAGMWTSLSDIIGRTGAAIADEQRRAPIRAQEQEARDLQLQGLKDERASREASAQEAAALKELFASGNVTEEALFGLIGPERGLKVMEGLSALDTQQQAKFKSTQELIAATLAGMDALPEPLRAEVFPDVRKNLISRGVITEQDAPEAYDPAWFQQARGFGQEPPKAPGTREVKTRDEQGNETIQIVQDTPGQTFTSAAPAKPRREVIVRGTNGRPVKKLVTEEELIAGVEQYQEPRVGAQPQYQRIETVDEAGNPLIQFLTPEEVRKQGGIRTSPKTTAKASGPATVDAILSEIDTLSGKINTSEGGAASNISGMLRSAAARANYDNDVSEYKALVEGFIPMVARAVGHTGVLTQQDVDSVRALFPLPTDNATLAKNKLDRVRRIMAAMQPEKPTTGSAKPPPVDPLGIRK